MFQDVYSWAGEYRRNVRLSKGNSHFCFPENIPTQIERLFADLIRQNRLKELERGEFARHAAHFLSELNAIHAFREGNGRTQNLFLEILANHAGHPLAMERLNPDTFLQAMILSFNGDEVLLAQQIADLCDE